MRSSQLKYNFNNIQVTLSKTEVGNFWNKQPSLLNHGVLWKHLLKASKRYSQLELFLIAIQYVTPSRKGGGWLATLKIGNPKICNMYKFNHINFADLALWNLHIQLYHQRGCNRNISSLKQRTIIWLGSQTSSISVPMDECQSSHIESIMTRLTTIKCDKTLENAFKSL